MTTSFPTTLDTFTNPTGANNLGDGTVLHSSQHANLNDAVAALEAKVGVGGSAVTTSTDYKLSHLQAIFRTAMTWSVNNGGIVVPSGSTGYLPAGFTPMGTSQTTKLVAVVHRIYSGTSLTFSVYNGAGAVTGFTGLSATTTKTVSTATGVSLTANDELRPVVTAVSGTVPAAEITLVLEHTVAITVS